MSCECDAFKRMLVEARDEKRALLYKLQCQNEQAEREHEAVREWRSIACEMSNALGDMLSLVREIGGYMTAEQQARLRGARLVHGGR